MLPREANARSESPIVMVSMTPRIYRLPWADLLKKVFAVDVLACPDCGGRLKLVAFIAGATVACRILDHLGLHSQGPPLARTQAQRELVLPLGRVFARKD